MTDHIIKLTDEHAARAEEAARAASNAGATAGAIFERRDPVRTLAMQSKIVEVLSTIFDPEIPVNIYELGLIYEVAVDADNGVGVRMTLTALPKPVSASALTGILTAAAIQRATITTSLMVVRPTSGRPSSDTDTP